MVEEWLGQLAGGDWPPGRVVTAIYSAGARVHRRCRLTCVAEIELMDLLPDFHVLSSTRYDPHLLTLAWNTAANDGQPSPFLLPKYHLDRINQAAQAHGWIVSLAYHDLVAACEEAVRKALSISAGGDASLKVVEHLETSTQLTSLLVENSVRPPGRCHGLGHSDRTTAG